jgi:TonB-dependent starch-binding outer membrane protein SusC
MKQLFFLLIVALLSTQQSIAQKNFRISGTVISGETKQAIEGATVQLKGSKESAITHSDGTFSIDASVNNPILVISHIGFKSKEVKPGSKLSGLVITLEKNEVAMEQVIVSTGYEQMTKENTTGSFDKIDEKLLNRSASTDILSRLEGTASSVYFSKTSTYPEIFIRGISTINAGTAPLIVIDNFPYEGDINNINPNDVESITILKDAAASAIWGAKAGNGVIVITTKKGEYNQKSRVVFNANTTIQQKPDLFKDHNFLDSKDFIDVEKYLFANGNYDGDLSNQYYWPVISPVVEILAKQRDGVISHADADAQINELGQHDVRNDYSKYLYRQSVMQQYSLNLSGGGNTVKYFLSGGLDNDISNLVGNKSQRGTFYAETTVKPLKKLELKASIHYSFTKEINNSILPDVYPGGGKSVYYPYARFTDNAGNLLALEKNYRAGFVDTTGGGLLLDWKYIPLQEQQMKDNTSSLQDVLMKVSLKYYFSNSLTAEFSSQLEKSNGNNRAVYNQNTFLARDLINLFSELQGNSILHNVPAGGILDNTSSVLSAYALRGQLNYHKRSNDYLLDIIGGGEIRENHTSSQSGRTYGYNDNLLTFIPVDYVTVFNLWDNLGQQPIIDMTDFSDTRYRYISLYSNAAFTYKNRYTISASGRRDASNLFGVNSNQKWNPLWSAGAAWNISNESFYHSGLFPFLRLRVTYGYNGNFQNNLSALATIRYLAGSPPTNLPKATINNPANPDLSWEKTAILNAAIDFSTKNSKLQGSIEYYHKNSTDLLSPVPVDRTTGVTQMTMNSADLEGKGIDVKINSRIIDRKIKWDVQFLFNYVTNKVTRYLLTYTIQNPSYGNVINPVVGQDPYALISYKWGGLDHETGNPIGYNHDTLSQDYSSITYSTTYDNMVISGTSRPPVFGNLITTLSWKGISISANLSYKLHYYFRKNSIDYGALFNNWQGNKDFVNRWQKPGDELHTNVPSMVYPDDYYRDMFYSLSEATVLKGDQLRLQDINISFNPQGLRIGNYDLKNLTFYSYINNVGLLWVKNKDHIDPDYQNNVPPGLSISFGLKATF